MKFLYPTLVDEKLYKELYKFNDLIKNFCSTSGSTNYEQTSSQLNEMVKGLKLEDLKNRIKLLVLLRGHIDFTNIRKTYDDWCFIDLMDDVNFRQEYVSKVVEERERPISENLKKNIDKCASLTAQGKQIASKYSEGKVSFQAYCEETDNASRTLNINLINYNGSEPIKISDILQQEKDIGKLNIYCNKKHDICDRREDKKRYYEFKEGACY
ncbi:MAG: hypothetical protein ACEY3A_00460 [Wolbachia sp.]